jgi:hypothetical protein
MKRVVNILPAEAFLEAAFAMVGCWWSSKVVAGKLMETYRYE